jgi:Protein of unknown function (DUF4239)
MAVRGVQSVMQDLGYPAVVAIVLGAGLVAASIAWLTRRLVRLEVLRHHHEVGSAIFLQLGVVFAVLLAFVFSEVWSEYNAASISIDQEASALNGIIMLSQSMPPQARQRVAALMGTYLDDVVMREMPEMRQRQASAQAEQDFQGLWSGIAVLPAGQSEDRLVMGRVEDLMAQAHQNRDMRIYEMTKSVPPLLWVLLLAFACVLVAFLLFCAVEYIVSQMLFIGVFAACLAFILLLVQLLDFPFEGPLRLDDGPFQETRAKITALANEAGG